MGWMVYEIKGFILKSFEGPVIHLYLYNPADLSKTLLGSSEDVSFTPQSFLTVLGVVRVKESQSCFYSLICAFI